MAKWCNYYNCWCSDIEEILEGNQSCDEDCNDCENLMIVGIDLGEGKDKTAII